MKDRPKPLKAINDAFEVKIVNETKLRMARVIGIEWGWWLNDWLYIVMVNGCDFSLTIRQKICVEGFSIFANGHTARVIPSNDKTKTQ